MTMDDDEKEWRESLFAEIVSNSDVSRLALEFAQDAREPTDPQVMMVDLASGRRYLHAVIMRMGEFEVRKLFEEDAAAFWGRGALGSARFRRKCR